MDAGHTAGDARLDRRGRVEDGQPPPPRPGRRGPCRGRGAHGRGSSVDGPIPCLRGDRARRHASRPERLRDVPAAAECGRVGAGPDADGARRGRRPRRRARRRSGRLPHETLLVCRAARPAARARPARRRRAADGADRRHAPPRSGRPTSMARPNGDQSLPQGVRPVGGVHAPPWTGPLAAAAARACLGLRVRESLERHRRLRSVHSREGGPPVRNGIDRDGPRSRLPAPRGRRRVNRLPIRLRLTLVFALTMAVVLLLAGWLVYARVSSNLGNALDEQLRSRAQDVSALVLREGSLKSTHTTLIERGETFAELVNMNGSVVDATNPVGRTPLPPAELARALGGPVFIDRSSVPGLDEPARMLALPVQRGQSRLVLVVGATRANRTETLASLRNAFLIGGPLALILASLAGYWLAGAALRPIEAMRRRAAAISASSLDDRLPVPPSGDEVSRLGETLNEMLRRIGDGLARERRFVADASHELRTPLALLKTELELALRRSRTTAELEAAIRGAAEDTERLSRIADDLLLLARAEQGRVPLRREPVDVADVLDTVAGRFQSRAESEQRDLSVAADDDPLVVSADRSLLEQALANMVDNAFTHGAGRVTLTAEQRNGSAELHVLDEGTGFPADFLQHAFERFSRAQTTAEGSGLGLAIVETIAEAHDGRAGAANSPGGGTDVWLSLIVER